MSEEQAPVGVIGSVVATEGDDDEALIISMEDDEESITDSPDLVNYTVTNTTPSQTTPLYRGTTHTVSAPLSANTKRNMEWAVRVWEKWAFYHNQQRGEDHNKIPTGKDFVTATPGELAKACSLFVQTVTKADGSPYPPHSIYNLLFAMSRYLKFSLKRTEVDILDFRSSVNTPIQEAMDEVTRKYSESEILNENKADAITWEHVKVLWDKGVLNYHSAKGLSRAAFIYNSKVFGIRSGRDHRLLLLEYFEFGEDDNGKYVEFHKGKFYKAKKEANRYDGPKFTSRPKVMTPSSMATMMQCGQDDMRVREYEVPGNQRCAYIVHKSYLDTVHQYVRYGPFYIKPQPTEVGTRIRFTSAAVGHNSLGTYVKDMMADAGIEGYFTNLSAGKQEQNKLPDWVNTPETGDPLNPGPIIINTASVNPGAPTYLQCLQKNVRIAPKPSSSEAAGSRVIAPKPTPKIKLPPVSAPTRTLTLAPASTAQPQTLVLVPVNEATTAHVNAQTLLTPTFKINPLPAQVASATTTSDPTLPVQVTSPEVMNSVTVKEEVISDDDDVRVKQEPEDAGYENPTSASDATARDFYANYLATENEADKEPEPEPSGSSSSTSSKPEVTSPRKRPLAIEPITEPEAEDMTGMLLKKLKALEDRLQRIEKDEKGSPPPDAPDSSHESEKPPTKRSKVTLAAESEVMEKLEGLETRLMRLEKSGPVTRSSSTSSTSVSSASSSVETRLKALEKTMAETKKAVSTISNKLNQTHSKLDKITDMLLATHSKRK